MRERRLFAWLIVVAGLVAALASVAAAADREWLGTLVRIVNDSGTGNYTGGVEGTSPFSGAFQFGDTCGAGCIVEPFPPDATNYVFTGGTGVLTGLGVTTFGVESSVEINDDELLDQDAVDLLAEFGIIANVGDPQDAWTVASETSGEGIVWEVAYLYLTTDPFSNTDYTPTPPPGEDIVIFEVNEGDETLYFAFGEVMTIPEPAGGLMLAFGVAQLGWLAGRRRRAGPRARGAAR